MDGGDEEKVEMYHFLCLNGGTYIEGGGQTVILPLRLNETRNSI